MLKSYFLQHIKMKGGFVDLFPKKQWLFLCPDIIPHSWVSWLLLLGVCSLVGEITSSSNSTFYERVKQTPEKCSYFLSSGEVKKPWITWEPSAEHEGSMEDVCPQPQW